MSSRLFVEAPAWSASTAIRATRWQDGKPTLVDVVALLEEGFADPADPTLATPTGPSSVLDITA